MHALITVRYFAMLREAAGRAEEKLEISIGESASQLYERLAAGYHFALRPEQLRFAVNDRFVGPERELVSGDVVVFIPPVAGG